MHETLQIIHWPDPRLLKVAEPVTTFDEGLKDLAKRMFELMREEKGVGLAAPQVGICLRLFVMNATGQPGDDRVYVNPELSEEEGSDVDEEGCLSLPGIRCEVERSVKMRLTAQTLSGEAVTEVAEGFVARVWQHETDHLNGKLLLNHMGMTKRMLVKKKLRELEDDFKKRK